MENDATRIMACLIAILSVGIIMLVCLIVLSSAVLANSFIVSWKPNPAPDSVLFYHIYNVTETDTVFIATVPAPDTLYVTDQMDRGDPHRYLIKAQNRFGYSAYSNEVSGQFLPLELDSLCYITELEIGTADEAIIRWHSEQPSVGGFQYKIAGAEEWNRIFDSFLLPVVRDHEHRINLERGYVYIFRAFCYPGAEQNLIISLEKSLDMTGTVPETPEAKIGPF